MADCCTPGSGFPTGPQLGQISSNLPVIWEEICMIQQAILEAASPCKPCGYTPQMCTVVGGDTPMTFVSGITDIVVTDGGSGYFEDTPSVYFQPPVGVTPTTVATGTVITNGGNIIGVTITDGGLGYQPVPSTMNVSSLTGTGALLQPLVTGTGQIVNINIANAGTGYTVNDTVTATRAVIPNIAYVNAVFRITSVSPLGEIVEVVILNPGSGYQDSVTVPRIVSTLNPLLPYPTGTGYMGSVFTDINGTIISTVVNNHGAGYTKFSPYLVITDPGTGAVTQVVLNGDSVEDITVIETGTGYTEDATGVVFNPPTVVSINPPLDPAIIDIVVSENKWCTNPNLYYQVWAGTATNKAILLQMNAVLSYFKGLGYTIVIQTNPDTGSTIQWKVCW